MQSQSSDVRCGTCPAWMRLQGAAGECHGKTPELIVLPAPPPPQGIIPPRRGEQDGMTRDFQIRSVFPPMLENGCCGKHPKFDWKATPEPELDTPVTAAFGGRA